MNRYRVYIDCEGGQMKTYYVDALNKEQAGQLALIKFADAMPGEQGWVSGIEQV